MSQQYVAEQDSNLLLWREKNILEAWEEEVIDDIRFQRDITSAGWGPGAQNHKIWEPVEILESISIFLSLFSHR